MSIILVFFIYLDYVTILKTSNIKDKKYKSSIDVINQNKDYDYKNIVDKLHNKENIKIGEISRKNNRTTMLFKLYYKGSISEFSNLIYDLKNDKSYCSMKDIETYFINNNCESTINIEFYNRK